MVERQDHKIVIHDMKWMAQFAGIANSRHVFQMSLVRVDDCTDKCKLPYCEDPEISGSQFMRRPV